MYDSLPLEVQRKILSLVLLRATDVRAILRAASVCQQWRAACEDEDLWRGVCLHHWPWAYHSIRALKPPAMKMFCVRRVRPGISRRGTFPVLSLAEYTLLVELALPDGSTFCETYPGRRLGPLQRKGDLGCVQLEWTCAALQAALRAAEGGRGMEVSVTAWRQAAEAPFILMRPHPVDEGLEWDAPSVTFRRQELCDLIRSRYAVGWHVQISCELQSGRWLLSFGKDANIVQCENEQRRRRSLSCPLSALSARKEEGNTKISAGEVIGMMQLLADNASAG